MPRAQPVDFSFKEGKFGDFATFKAALYSKEDQLARIATADAQFLGYSRDSKDKLAAPAFKYRVGKNVVEVSTTISARGELAIARERQARDAAVVRAESAAAERRDASAPASSTNDRWTLPAGKTNATLRATIAVAAQGLAPGAV